MPKYPTEIELAYCAGIIDGEGCISISPRKRKKFYKRKKQPSMGVTVWGGWAIRLRIMNNDEEMIKKFALLFDMKLKVKTHLVKGGRRLSYEVVAWNRKAQGILKQVLPYLVTKRKQAFLTQLWNMNYASWLPNSERVVRHTTRQLVIKLNARLNGRFDFLKTKYYQPTNQMPELTRGFSL